MTYNKLTTFGVALLLGLSTQVQANFEFEPLPLKAPEPADNPSTTAKIKLGKQLFFDARLSIDGTVSCNTCHDVSGNGTDSSSVSTGVDGQQGGRSAPSVWNAAFLSSQFWDGRAATLEDQAKGPILNPIEMGMPHREAAVERIAAVPGYQEQFKRIFGGDKPVTYDNIAKAIASYERTLITPNSPLDNYLRGDKSALSPKAQAGMQNFKELGCIRCHRGPAFAGPELASGEVSYQYFPAFRSEYDEKYKLTEDWGHRQRATPDEVGPGLWRVPSLRNIALTAPYFHNGSVPNLHEAVKVMARVQLNRHISEQEIDQLVAFLETLTGEFTVQHPPKLPADK